MIQHSRQVIPVVLDWAEKPTREVVLQPPPISCVWVKGGVDAILGPGVQESCDIRLDPRSVVAAGVVRPVKQLRRLR